MRIVNVIQCSNLGGMEQASLRLMKALKQRGHEIELLSLNPIGGLQPLLEEAGIPSRGLRYGEVSALETIFEMRTALKSFSPEAIIMTGHNFAASLALAGICPNRRILACHFHHKGVMPYWKWQLIYSAAKLTFRSITFPSDVVREEAISIAPFISKIANTVRNPLQSPSVDPSSRSSFRSLLGVSDSTPIIGNAGWLIQRKRFDIFLQTAAEIRRVVPNARFVIAGDGELRGSLEALAEKLGISENVTWLGWQENLSAFYSGLDVLLFNTDWDTFPTTPAEAMVHNVPVVASALHGGLSEVLDEETGWLFDVHDPEALAIATVAALGTEGRARSASAFKRILRMSHPDTIATIVEALLVPK